MKKFFSYGYIFLVLAIALSLFYMLNCLFGWAHYHNWPLLITKTESKLTGSWLQKYLNTHALISFLFGVAFFICFFDKLLYLCNSNFLFLLILTVRVEIHFKSIANQSNAGK